MKYIAKLVLSEKKSSHGYATTKLIEMRVFDSKNEMSDYIRSKLDTDYLSLETFENPDGNGLVDLVYEETEVDYDHYTDRSQKILFRNGKRVDEDVQNTQHEVQSYGAKEWYGKL